VYPRSSLGEILYMPMTVFPAATSIERSHLIPDDFIRHRALERLYKRRAAVEDLIRSLEGYERASQPRVGECVPFTAPPRCSSSCVR
jgi:hypothetical protein